MKVLIFGGTGFVGLNIAAALLVRGHAVTLFESLRDRLSELVAVPWFGVQAGQLTLVNGASGGGQISITGEKNTSDVGPA